MAGIHLTWSPRVRGEGAGLGSADGVTDAEPTWEGLFEIEVWVGTVLVQTVSDIDDDEYKFYTEEIKAWSVTAGCVGAPCCPTQIIFKLRNYRTEGATEFSSEKTVLKLRNYDGCDCGTATTTTTSTSSTTTSTSSSSSTTSSTTA